MCTQFHIWGTIQLDLLPVQDFLFKKSDDRLIFVMGVTILLRGCFILNQPPVHRIHGIFDLHKCECPTWNSKHLVQSNFKVFTVAACFLMMMSSMETYSVSLGLGAENSSVTGEFPTQRPVTWWFNDFFDLRLNKCLENNRDAGDLRSHRAHHDETEMSVQIIAVYCKNLKMPQTFIFVSFPGLVMDILGGRNLKFRSYWYYVKVFTYLRTEQYSRDCTRIYMITLFFSMV